MNKFIGQKLISNKWISHRQQRIVDTAIELAHTWTVFEKQDLLLTPQEQEKIRMVKGELQTAARGFLPAFSI